MLCACRCLLCVSQTYDALTKKLKEVSALGGISGLLGWDEMVRNLKQLQQAWESHWDQYRPSNCCAYSLLQVMMPAGAAESRAAQKSALAGVLYEASWPRLV